MATIMEKDVLLEYAHIGHLIINREKTQEIEQDSIAMGKLWNDILYSDHQDIDYEKTIRQIKAIRQKYE